MAKRRNDWNSMIRNAVKASGLSLYRIAKDAGIGIGPIQRFMNETHGLTLSSAEKLGPIVGIELRIVQRRSISRVKSE